LAALGGSRYDRCSSALADGASASGLLSERATFHGSTALCAASSQGCQASRVACAQNASGLVLSRKRPNASNDGIACRLIEISSASPSGERRCTISTSRPGRCAVARVASSSLGWLVPLNSDTGRLHL